MTKFWVIYYICLFVLDVSGMTTAVLRIYDNIQNYGKVRKTNIVLIVLWTVSLVLGLIGFFLKLVRG